MGMRFSPVSGFLAALTPTATVLSAAQEQTPSDLTARIDALQAQVDQLKSEQAAQTAQAKDRAAARDVVTDADRHSPLLDAQGVLAGYTNGRFILQSEDGGYLLHPWLQVQFRNTTDFRHDAVRGGTADDTQNGFEMRRLKFGADGNLFGSNLNYFTQFAVDRHTGNVQLEMAWLKYQFDDSPFAVRAGQFKDPLDHEQLTASRWYPAIDRTLINDTFANAEGFVKGVSFIYDPGTFVRTETAFTGGLRNYNTNFEQYPNAGVTTDWGAATRVEYKAFGNWTDYNQMSAYGVHADTLVFGAGADYTETGHSDALVHDVDVQFQTGSGLSLYAAYLGRYTTHNTSASVDTYDPTARIQAAWAIDTHWEPYARYEYIHFDGKEYAAGTKTTVNVFTAGANYYLYGQAFRLSLDVSYLPNGSPISDDGFGILADNGHNELVGRAQFQLLL